MVDVAVVIGSRSDLPMLKGSGMTDVFNASGVSWEVSVISAHRNPDALYNFCLKQVTEGTKVLIGVAGLAAQLPGVMTAHVGTIPVLGVPLSSLSLFGGLDALLAMIKMPKGSPVSVAGLDETGFYNTAIQACKIVAVGDSEVREKLANYLESKRKPAEYGVFETGVTTQAEVSAGT